MTDIMAEAVEAIEKKLEGSVFDGSAKFAIQDEGAIIIDSSGVRVSDDETEVTLSASLETFQEILQGDLDSASAFMTGRLQLDGAHFSTMFHLGHQIAQLIGCLLKIG